MKWLRNQEVPTICYRRKLQLKWVHHQTYLKAWCRTNRCCWLMVHLAWWRGKEKLIDRRLGPPTSLVTPNRLNSSHSIKVVAILSSQQVEAGSWSRQRCGNNSNTSSPEAQTKTNRPSSMIQWRLHCPQQEALAIGWSPTLLNSSSIRKKHRRCKRNRQLINAGKQVKKVPTNLPKTIIIKSSYRRHPPHLVNRP